MKQKLFIVDDESAIIEAMTRALQGTDLEIASSSNPEKALEEMKRNPPQVVITDLKMPRMNGIELLEKVKEFNASIQVILVTGYGTVDEAVAAMKKGAYDFIAKPFKKQEILAVVGRALEKVALLHENTLLKEKLRKNQGQDFEAGKSRVFRDLLNRAAQAAQSDATILVQGESGTGKEVVANHIEGHSLRAGKPFVKVNCAAIPEALLEAELFGYRKGAFTGAYQDKKGKFQEADGGTLFLDEIGEIPLALQPKLLRVLQEGEVSPVGGSTQQVDVRIIAATNKNLRKQVEAGLFREDLFYRLNVIPLYIPPLRQRKEDLTALISFFIGKYCRLNKKGNLSVSADALKKMENYAWPGNIRELENAVERAVILAPGHQIVTEDLPDELSQAGEPALKLDLAQGLTLEEIELLVIQSSLKRNHGDKVRTAEELGISLRTLYRRLDHLHPESGAALAARA